MKIDVDKMRLPHLDKDVYSAVCSAVWHLNAGAPLSRAIRRASEKYGTPMAKVERIIREGLPNNFFHKRQRQSIQRNPILAKSEAVMMQHMRNI